MVYDLAAIDSRRGIFLSSEPAQHAQDHRQAAWFDSGTLKEQILENDAILRADVEISLHIS
jgi:hypothetical protein